MDTQTRHALKKDKFAQATASSVSWVSGHRSGVLRWAIAAVVVLALGIGGIVFWNIRTAVADSALGAAMDVYNAPLTAPGAPPERIEHHKHTEMWLMREGTATLMTADSTCTLKVGDMGLCVAGDDHYITNASATEPASYFVVSVGPPEV